MVGRQTGEWGRPPLVFWNNLLFQNMYKQLIIVCRNNALRIITVHAKAYLIIKIPQRGIFIIMVGRQGLEPRTKAL